MVNAANDPVRGAEFPQVIPTRIAGGARPPFQRIEKIKRSEYLTYPLLPVLT